MSSIVRLLTELATRFFVLIGTMATRSADGTYPAGQAPPPGWGGSGTEYNFRAEQQLYPE